jgi:hypothetical protein
MSQSNIQLSGNAQISVITFGPYQGELWSAFGHNGVRVYDPDRNIDWIYDWGRFDFDQANFYWNFARGKLMYSIGRTQDFGRYKNRYVYEDRFVYEQVLNLTPQEVQRYFDYLENNNLPENQEYSYNYVFENCATRIRDITQEIVPNAEFNHSYKVPEKSVRDLMDDYLDYQPWGDFVIDIALADPIDEEARAETYMFLPDYIYLSFENSFIKSDSGNIPLIRKTNKIYEPKNEPVAVGWFTPINFFVLLFFVVGFITNKNFRTLKRTHWIDVILFSFVGFLGWWFTFLWFVTDHLSMYNWNLLWAIPLHLPFVFFLKREKWRPYLARFYRYTAILNVLILVFWALIPQPLHFALVPLILTMALRAFYISYDLGRIKLPKT